MSREDYLNRIAEIAARWKAGQAAHEQRVTKEFAAHLAEYEKLLGVERPVVSCVFCRAKNRVTPGKPNPTCGACKLPLPTKQEG